MDRQDAIGMLDQIMLDGSIGMGDYTDTAAYKLANGDISPARLACLRPDLAEACAALGDGRIAWGEIGR